MPNSQFRMRILAGRVFVAFHDPTTTSCHLGSHTCPLSKIFLALCCVAGHLITPHAFMKEDGGRIGIRNARQCGCCSPGTQPTLLIMWDCFCEKGCREYILKSLLQTIEM